MCVCCGGVKMGGNMKEDLDMQNRGQRSEGGGQQRIMR